MTVDTDPAVGVFFKLKIDDNDLGAWNSCEGLGAEVVLESREEGGNNLYVWQLPTRVKYSNVKLTRPLTADTQKVAKWFASMAGQISRKTAEIQAVAFDGTQPVARWGLVGVVPVRWTGPSFNLDSPKVATETIEIAHHGFIDTGA